MSPFVRCLVIIAFLVGCKPMFCANVVPGNIVIDRRDIVVDIDTRDGKAVKLKVHDDYVVTAERVNETGALAKFYDTHSEETVDKASSPGFKPIYRASENDDIFYSGSRICLLPFEAKVGKKTKLSFETTAKIPERAGTIPLSSVYKTKALNVTVKIPAEIVGKSAIRFFNIDNVKPDSTTDIKGDLIVTFTLTDIEAMRKEEMAPSPQKSIPIIEIYSALTTLDDVYAYLKGFNEDLSTIDPEVAAMAHSIADTVSGGAIERINAIASWVRQNIRYVAIEHGEFGISPDKASAVLAKRFGDCKGSANLLAAMFRAIDIDGRRVWIGTRGDVVAPFSENPSLSAGNHMIAAAVLPDTTVFVDGTSTFAPRGMIPYSIAGQECMMENGDSYILTRVPPAAGSPGELMMEADLTIDGTKLSGDTRLTYTGSWRMMFENTMASVNANRRESLVDALFKSGRKSIVLSSEAVAETAAPDARTSQLTANVTDNEGVRAVSGRSKLYVMPRPLRMHSWSTVDEKDRRLPISVERPLTYSARISIAVPEGYRPAELPKRVDIANRWFAGFVAYEDGGEGKVLCTASLTPVCESAPAGEVAEWNKAVKEVERANSTALVLLSE